LFLLVAIVVALLCSSPLLQASWRPVGSNPFSAGRPGRGKRQIGQSDTLSFRIVLAYDFGGAIIVHFKRDHRDDAPLVVGMSVETTCCESMDYFRSNDRFADFVIHEAAHVFPNCKRRTLGLPATRRREWLLEIDFGKRETFAYACEAYSRILELSDSALARRTLCQELEGDSMPPDAQVCTRDYIDILRSAVAARNGWRKILMACTPARPSRTRRS
jgi:hypothetical protein